MQDVSLDPTAQRAGQDQNEIRISSEMQVPGIFQLAERLSASSFSRASSVCLPKKGVMDFTDVILVHFQGRNLECTIISNVNLVHPGRLA